MEDGAIIFILVLWLGPILWHVNECKKRKRNIFLSTILSTLFITIIWLSFFGWWIGIGVIDSLTDGLKVWLWIPIYIVSSIVTLILTVSLIVPFENAYDSYLKTGKITIGFKLPKILNKIFNKN
tara:strand:- start:245 stop:616 length:372 start_codon:yes stop_codon:yes gene_type:complete